MFTRSDSPIKRPFLPTTLKSLSICMEIVNRETNYSTNHSLEYFHLQIPSIRSKQGNFRLISNRDSSQTAIIMIILVSKKLKNWIIKMRFNCARWKSSPRLCTAVCSMPSTYRARSSITSNSWCNNRKGKWWPQAMLLSSEKRERSVARISSTWPLLIRSDHKWVILRT